MLHVTNGDSTAALLRAADIEGLLLPWRDVLHEGPVPSGLDLDALSDVRARFLAGRGWGDYPSMRREFAHRDETIKHYQEHEEVVLWFEHDLYDQLQIAQIMDWFARQDRSSTRLTMICIGSYTGVLDFRGLGDLTPTQAAGLYDLREPITPHQLDLASAIWQAFCHPDPTDIEIILARDTSALPFMEAALRRHLQEFPSTRNGLGCTQHGALQALAMGLHDPVALFKAHLSQEESPFVGDWSFWDMLVTLADVPHPLLHIDRPAPTIPIFKSTLSITDDGKSVLDGTKDFITLNGINRWYGGVYLHGPAARWRWDVDEARLRSYTVNA